MNILLLIAIISAAVYLILDAIQKYAAVQELVRITFFASLVAYLFGAFK